MGFDGLDEALPAEVLQTHDVQVVDRGAGQQGGVSGQVAARLVDQVGSGHEQRLGLGVGKVQVPAQQFMHELSHALAVAFSFRSYALAAGERQLVATPGDDVDLVVSLGVAYGPPDFLGEIGFVATGGSVAQPGVFLQPATPQVDNFIRTCCVELPDAVCRVAAVYPAELRELPRESDHAFVARQCRELPGIEQMLAQLVPRKVARGQHSGDGGAPLGGVMIAAHGCQVGLEGLQQCADGAHVSVFVRGFFMIHRNQNESNSFPWPTSIPSPAWRPSMAGSKAMWSSVMGSSREL